MGCLRPEWAESVDAGATQSPGRQVPCWFLRPNGPTVWLLRPQRAGSVIVSPIARGDERKGRHRDHRDDPLHCVGWPRSRFETEDIDNSDHRDHEYA